MEGIIYLDNAATTFPKPQVVYDFMHEFFMKHGINPGRSGYDAAMATEEVVNETRKMFTEFFNGDDPDRLTFSYNGSDSLNQIIGGVLKPGDHVVSTTVEHNSVIRPLHHRERDGMIEVTYVPNDGQGYVDPDDVKQAFRPDTALCIINHCSNAFGTVQPITEIGAHCKEAEIPYAIDASQTAGAVPIDMKKSHIDFVAFTGHKSLMGPTGIGGICTAADAEIKATRQGGTGVRSKLLFHLEEFPYRLECGTMNVMGVGGLHAGMKWLREEGMENVHRREMALWTKFRDALRAIDGVTTYCDDDATRHSPVLSCNVANWEAFDVGILLDADHNIATRTGLHCAPLVHKEIGTADIKGTVRFSFGPFNTDEHVDLAIAAIDEIASIRRGK